MLEVAGREDFLAAGTIFDKLDAVGISWREYTAQHPQVLLFPSQLVRRLEHVTDIEQFLADATPGDLPAYSLITPHGDTSEENQQDMLDFDAPPTYATPPLLTPSALPPNPLPIPPMFAASRR